jgi:hypothetical protein
LFTKVIMSPSKEAWVLDRQKVWLKEKHRHFNFAGVWLREKHKHFNLESVESFTWKSILIINPKIVIVKLSKAYRAHGNMTSYGYLNHSILLDGFKTFQWCLYSKWRFDKWASPNCQVWNRHDRNPRFFHSQPCLKIYYSLLTPIISHLLIVNTMLPTH